MQEEVLRQGSIDVCRSIHTRERGKLACFSGAHILFGLPDVLRGGPGKQVRPVGVFTSLDGFEVAKFGKLGKVYHVV